MSEQIDVEKMKEILERNRNKNPTERICESFYNDVITYLKSKLSGFPDHELMDIAVFCGNRMMVTANDLLFERDQEWRDHLEREERRKHYARRAAEMNFGDKED